jgi:hypothetical protein
MDQFLAEQIGDPGLHPFALQDPQDVVRENKNIITPYLQGGQTGKRIRIRKRRLIAGAGLLKRGIFPIRPRRINGSTNTGPRGGICWNRTLKSSSTPASTRPGSPSGLDQSGRILSGRPFFPRVEPAAPVFPPEKIIRKPNRTPFPEGVF